MQLLRLLTIPALYGILVIIASIIMFSLPKKMSMVFQITIGFLVSIIIYYLIFFSTSLGTGGKIPLELSVFFFPILILLIICTIGLVSINENRIINFLVLSFFVGTINSYSQEKILFLKHKINQKRWKFNYCKFWKST